MQRGLNEKCLMKNYVRCSTIQSLVVFTVHYILVNYAKMKRVEKKMRAVYGLECPHCKKMIKIFTVTRLAQERDMGK